WAREAQLRAAGQLFSADAADAVAQVAVWGPPPLPRLRPVVRAVRVAYSATLVGALAWFGMTTGVGVAAAAAGAGVAHPPAGHANAVYLGVRLNRAELSSSVVEQDLRALHASAVLEVSTARLEGAEVHRWVAAGISLESGGVGFQRGAVGAPVAPWSVARMDSQSVHVLSTLAGCSVAALVPDRSISAFDLVDASSAHVKMVVPNTTLPVPPSGPFPQSDIAVPELQSGHVYVVDGRKITPLQLTVLLGELGSQLRSQRLPSAPLSGLQ
ncbi:MAG TPA: hypothetical protein VK425_04985, partial [Acidimicrobiales bacterium]|nr:hypothetical protein [Acidimicrobiales bacterium]